MEPKDSESSSKIKEKNKCKLNVELCEEPRLTCDRSRVLHKAKLLLDHVCSLCHECEDKMSLYWELNEELLALLRNPMNCLMIKQEIIQRCLVPCGAESIEEVSKMTANLLVIKRIMGVFSDMYYNLNDTYEFRDDRAVDLETLWRLVSIPRDMRYTRNLFASYQKDMKSADFSPMVKAFDYACAVAKEHEVLFKLDLPETPIHRWLVLEI